MKKPLKFRVWCNLSRSFNNTFQDENFIGIDIHGKSFWIVEGKVHYPQIHIVQEFTGLLDKNGKEIYDGDILTYKSETIDGRHSCNGIVVWYDNFCWAFQHGRYESINDVWFLNSDFDFKRVTISGNICQDPTLENYHVF